MSGADEVAVALGRKIMVRKAPPGWDDIHTEGWRAVKLPVHDMLGATSYIVVFGGDFDPKRAQAIVERFALMLGPMVEGVVDSGKQLADAAETSQLGGSSGAAGRGGGYGVDAAAEQVLAVHQVMEPVLRREIQHANSKRKIDELHNQISDVRKIMEQNVDMILDRQEDLEALSNKTEALASTANTFRKKTRQLRRWHLMNQVKWGVMVGTVVTASVAIPIALLIAV
jgi:hypothetical protein